MKTYIIRQMLPIVDRRVSSNYQIKHPLHRTAQDKGLVEEAGHGKSVVAWNECHVGDCNITNVPSFGS